MGEYKKGPQNERFKKVMKALKDDKGFSQRDVFEIVNLNTIGDETFFSNLKSGKRKSIPKDLIDALQEKFQVNPAYLRGESESIFETAEIKWENFQNIVESCSVLKGEMNKYLDLKMKERDINFFIGLLEAKKLAEEGRIDSFEKEKNILIKKYNDDSSKLQEFVLIPRNVFYKIVSNPDEKEKYIEEVIDFNEYINEGILYSDEKDD